MKVRTAAKNISRIPSFAIVSIYTHQTAVPTLCNQDKATRVG